VRDRFDVAAGADQDRAAVVAAHAQDGAGDPLEQVPQGGDVDEREEQRPVEDVVARELLALDDREQHHDDRRLEQRGDHAREAGAHRPVRVEVGACEQQQRDEDCQRRDVLGLVERQRQVGLVAQERLELECRPDGQEDAAGVERAEDEDARHRADGAQPDDRPQEEWPPRAHVARRERGDSRSRLELL
jgi:hypothetical protein